MPLFLSVCFILCVLCSAEGRESFLPAAGSETHAIFEEVLQGLCCALGLKLRHVGFIYMTWNYGRRS